MKTALDTKMFLKFYLALKKKAKLGCKVLTMDGLQMGHESLQCQKYTF